MGKRTFVPQVGNHLRKIANILLVISFIALIVTIFTWTYAISHSSGYSSMYERSSSLSGLAAFGFVIYSLEGIIASFVLKGFSYVVNASIHYLDKEGEFDEKENA